MSPLGKRKKVKQPNVIVGYDNGEITMYYWQREPIKTRTGSLFTISRWLWWNPIWRLKQWYMARKPITFREFKHFTNSL